VSEEKKLDKNNKGAMATALNEIAEPFIGLANSSRALWGLYISYLFEGLVYFGVLTVLGKYLSENVGLSDLHAGWVYSGFTGGITLAMLFLGGLSDKLGIRKALMFSLGIMIFGRAMLGISGTFFPQGLGSGSLMFLSVVLGLFVIVLGYGTYQPAAYSAVKQFTNKKTASISYAMIYGLMNLGAFFSGIISPIIRDGGGIESVFWVYTGLTVLAFLTVTFVMTRKVIERDVKIAKSEDEEDKTEEEKAETAKAEAAAAKPAQPEAKLMTPGFLVFVSASVLSVIAIIFMVISAQINPAVVTMREAKAIVGSVDTSDDALITESSANLEGKAALIVTPEPSHADGVVDPEVFDLVRYQMELDAQLMVAARDLKDASIEAGNPNALLVFEEVRKLGLYYMAAAYAQVSTVDDGVIENLRSRLKEAGGDLVPLTDAQMASLKTLVQQEDFTSLCTALANASLESKGTIGAIDADAGKLVGLVLENNANMFTKSGKLQDSDTAVDVVQQRLLSQSVYLVNSLAPSFKNELEKEGFFPKILRSIKGEEAPTLEEKFFTKVELLDGYSGVTAEYYNKENLEGFIAKAETLPGSVSFMRWAKRYGWLVLLAIICLGTMGSILLKKRPLHPFNDKNFVFFIFILIPVQTLFAHNWLTLPYYIDRAFGGTTVGDNFEFFSNLNPILIFFLAPMVAALTTKAKVYPMMIWGTFVMAVPTFLLVLPPTPFMLLTYILLMSIGEAMWQPRFLQWVAEIAPEGQTGTYMGIGQFPWFLTKVLTGLYSGYFLSQYCPAVGPQNTQFMWLIYALIAMVTPVGLVLARNWMMKTAGEKSTA